MKEGIITEAKFILGVSDILEIGSDLEIDIPKFWDTLASLLVAPVMDGFLSLGTVLHSQGFGSITFKLADPDLLETDSLENAKNFKL